MRLLTLYLDEKDIDTADILVYNGFYPNRSEQFRFFIRQGLKDKMKEIKDAEIVLEKPPEKDGNEGEEEE
jgi:Arc/MetJ-type ribon-helix-helix transcriptional regulator